MDPKEIKEYTEYQQYTADKWSEILEHYKIVVSRVESVEDLYRKLYKENTDQLREATFETVTGEWALNEVLEKMEENLKLYIGKLKKCISKLKVNIDRLKVEINDGKHKRPKDISIFTKQANKFIDYLNMVINFYNNGEFIIDGKVLNKDSFLSPMDLIEIRKVSTRNQNGQRKTKVIVKKKY